jgi:hypothetical protein
LSIRKVSDDRLRQAWARCPDDDSVLVPTGDMYSSDESGRSWSIAFRCPEHPDEILRIWQPDLQPLIDEVLGGVDVASLPLVDRPG